jgi:manganese/zinc/iron transport system permease protein
MTTPQIEIQIIASLVAVACAIPGVFLVLRKMAMISDAISHAILPGIVVGFLFTGSLNSPLLIVLAAVTGLLTVVLVELLSKTNLVKEDAAIGLVFPALFSVGVIMISRNASNIHIDTDAVLMGEIAFAPFDRLVVGGIDLGPQNTWVMSVILLINLLFTIVFFKELKISTFDAGLAASLGFAPVAMNYTLMATVSITTVGAFDAVGAILVVAFMIVPAATAYLLTDDLKAMLMITIVIGIVTAISGYWVARFLDVSISGAMATMCGLIFLAVYILAPQRGLLSIMKRKKRQRAEFSQMTLAMHIFNHSGENEDIEELRVSHLRKHLGWQPEFAESVVKSAAKRKLLKLDGEVMRLTDKGESFVKAAGGLISATHHPEFQTLRKEFIIFSD